MISMNWVKDYLDIENEDLKELATKITKAGVNIEKVITNHIENLVIGEVVDCINHPESDHLHVCKVNVGKEVLQIVCGAHNVRKNIKVIVALPGAILPGNFAIKQSTIRGVESSGMICALFELGLEPKTDENYNKGIEELNNDAPVGEDALKYLGYDDTLYDVDIHKHRNNDCYYHIGFAYEVGTILNKKVKLPESNYNEINDSINNHFKLSVETDKCPYYAAKMVTDVEIKESPEFIKRRLESAGMRSINNVVDISNYVMLEYGQPMHFFDKDKLGNSIVVRMANNNEKIITLDNKERTLKNSDIVITNGKESICIAGVMGGLNTDVDSNTKNILIESAIFDATSIRYTSNNLNLKSEASIRYGKGLNYEYTLEAINRACYLLEKYANAKVLKDIVLYDNIDKTEKTIDFIGKDINKILGIEIDDESIKTELNRLDFKFEYNNGKFHVIIPRRRLDIDSNIADISEEIGRLYGYKNLVSTLPKGETRRGRYIGDVEIRKSISKRLRSLGLNETKGYTLVSKELADMFNYENKETAILPNPMSSDKSILRTSLLPSLLTTYDYNNSRGVKDILIYEIAKTYNEKFIEDTKVAILVKGNYLINEWQGTTKKCDFYLLKGIIENLFNFLGFKNRYTFEKLTTKNMHPGVCATILMDKEPIGIIGRVHPLINQDEIFVAELSMTKLYEKKVKQIKYKEVSKYPSIVKDLAFVVNKNISCKEIEDSIKKNGGRNLTNVDLFDLYTGKNIDSNYKSLAYSLTFNSNEKTLTIDEVDIIFKNIIDNVCKEYNCEIRDK